MKKIILTLIAVLISVSIMPITAKAEENAVDLYKRDPDAFWAKYKCLDKEAEEQGLYSDANDGAFVKRNKNKKKDTKETTQQTTTTTPQTGQGWVYSTDELHIVGLPEDESGYTKSGFYGSIE